ncbi:MAG TPA: hypothetical protein VK794_11620 [Steroidobacteraceae bacterium]|jgi:hypothetical protein|nr:hypothetical protein [Steroidobacteraceae bacterium]
MFMLLLGSQSACVATKYKLAKKNTPPIELLDRAFPASPTLQPTLVTLISYRGAGSWKREALWDEYVVALENRSEQPITIDSATLADAGAATFAAGNNPWALEKQSKHLEKQYRDHGEGFMRAAGPGVLIVGMGAATVSATAGTTMFVSAGVVGAALAAVVVVPVYYLSVLGINHHNKKAVMTEFQRRRLPLPLILAAGETRTGSLFYPMVRSPGSLTLSWSNESGSSTSMLSLDFLQMLHVPVPTPKVTGSPGPKSK